MQGKKCTIGRKELYCIMGARKGVGYTEEKSPVGKITKPHPAGHATRERVAEIKAKAWRLRRGWKKGGREKLSTEVEKEPLSDTEKKLVLRGSLIIVKNQPLKKETWGAGQTS